MQELRNRRAPETAVEEWLPEGIAEVEPAETGTGEWVAPDVEADWVGESVPEDWTTGGEDAVAPEPEPQSEAVAPEPEPEAVAPEFEAEPEAVAPEPEPGPEADAVELSEFVPLAPPAPASDPESGVLREALARAEQRAAAAEERADSLQQRLQRQEALTEEARRAAGAERLEAALAASPSAADGRLDLNRATFEALRALGLSVSQAARFIGQRDERGGLRSMDDLASLYGLPSDILRTLYEHGAV